MLKKLTFYFNFIISMNVLQSEMRTYCSRRNTKVIFIFMICSLLICLILLWNKRQCSVNIEEKDKCPCASGNTINEFNDHYPDIEYLKPPAKISETQSSLKQPYSTISCIINGHYSVQCRQENDEVFVPFSFIERYFEVYGKLSENVSGKFEWQHSYSQVYPQVGKYKPDGVFMSFEHYNVEARPRVKCITATNGVPVSIQWGNAGYFYPIQIAQFGLSHYSKHLVGKPKRVVYHDDFERSSPSRDWKVSNERSSFSIVKEGGSRVLLFDTGFSKDDRLTLTLKRKSKFILCLSYRFINNGSFSVLLKRSKSEEIVRVNYVQTPHILMTRGTDVYYGLGQPDRKWHTIHRDVSLDFAKGLMSQYKKSKKPKLWNLINQIVGIQFIGHGYVDNVSLATSVHMEHFFSAANWMISAQDISGGWPINVRRRLVPEIMELDPGWYSAMGQGQAISLLVRAYLQSGNRKYIECALIAVKLYTKESKRGGVATKFLNVYDWFEEYPTQPSSFVLNGFIFSLIGLYDLKACCHDEFANDERMRLTSRLFESGMKSLRTMLNLFDTGSGSMYDLRHISAGLSPNLARWDYHATHIIQLNLLATIDPDPIFRNTASRWHGYMFGRKAKHN